MRQFNAVVLGAGGVGKSALTVRFMRDLFVDGYDPTIEEAYRKAVTVDGELCSLEVLDTAGAEQFTALNEYYIQGGAGFILVFSLTAESTIREIENLRQQIYRVKAIPLPGPRKAASSRPHTSHGEPSGAPTRDPSTTSALSLNTVPLVIVGTKSDLQGEREVSREAVTRLATLWGVPFYETSAKRNWNVSAVFMDIIRQMKTTYPDGSRAKAPRSKRGHRCVVQ